MAVDQKWLKQSNAQASLGDFRAGKKTNEISRLILIKLLALSELLILNEQSIIEQLNAAKLGL